jgi:hypothetical protein
MMAAEQFAVRDFITNWRSITDDPKSQDGMIKYAKEHARGPAPQRWRSNLRSSRGYPTSSTRLALVRHKATGALSLHARWVGRAGPALRSI